jgi:glyceraldehyde-3-phosphate dehydrogenase type I
MTGEQVNVCINGYGRIGTVLARVALTDQADQLNIVAINAGNDFDPHDIAVRTEYDSTHGYLQGSDYQVPYDGNEIRPLGESIRLDGFRDLGQARWGDYGDDLIVAEATGSFLTQEAAKGHIDAGAKAVAITAPAKDKTTQTIVCGVNDDIDSLGGVESVAAASSCSTNCIAPVMKVLSDNFNTRWGIANIPHAYTNSQRGLDGKGTKVVDRRSHDALIPASTGSAKEVARLFPHLEFFKAYSMRAPVSSGSVAMLTIAVDGKISAINVAEVLDEASSTTHKGIIATKHRAQTSAKIVGSEATSIIDLRRIETEQTRGQTLINLQAWFDNEYGYSSQVGRLLQFMGMHIA